MAWELAGDIADRIRELRALLGETQEVFAARFTRGWKQVSAWETGKAKPAQAVLEQTARASGWPVEMFAEGGPRPRDAVNPAVYRAGSGSLPPPYVPGSPALQAALGEAFAAIMPFIEADRAIPWREVLRLLNQIQRRASGEEPPTGGAAAQGTG